MAEQKQRLHFVDNLRLAMIALVVLVHAAVTYSGLGRWYYLDVQPQSEVSQLVFVLFQAFCQSFFMGLLFLLAGYYARAALARKGTAAFVRGRLARLGLPALFYMLVLSPLTVYLADTGGVRAKADLARFWAAYLTGLHFLGGSGPLWFALALLGFCLVYAGLCVLRPLRAPGPARPLTPRLVLVLILACALASFLVRLRWPIGSAVLNMQLCYFSQYVLFFILGLAAQRNDWLRSLDARLGRPCLLLAAAGLPVLAALTWYALGQGGLAPYFGGLSWQALSLAAWESASGVCMCLGLIWAARERWNRSGPLLSGLADLAFAVYVFHAPVVVALGRLLAPLQAPALAKFLLLGALSLPAGFGLAWLIRRIPLLRELVRA